MDPIRWLVGWMHVGMSEKEVVSEVLRKVSFKDGRDPVAGMAEIAHRAVEAHNENRALYRSVMTGRIR